MAIPNITADEFFGMLEKEQSGYEEDEMANYGDYQSQWDEISDNGLYDEFPVETVQQAEDEEDGDEAMEPEGIGMEPGGMEFEEEPQQEFYDIYADRERFGMGTTSGLKTSEEFLIEGVYAIIRDEFKTIPREEADFIANSIRKLPNASSVHLKTCIGALYFMNIFPLEKGPIREFTKRHGINPVDFIRYIFFLKKIIE